MRRGIVVALVLGLLVAALVGPAEAGKKKRRPIVVKKSGAFALSNPTDFEAGAGIVRNEFMETCAIPASQGLDGFVFQLPKNIRTRQAKATLTGSDSTGFYDLDMYFFTKSCESNGEVSTEAVHEQGIMPAGTRFVLISAYFGAELEFNFKAVAKR